MITNLNSTVLFIELTYVLCVKQVNTVSWS